MAAKKALVVRDREYVAVLDDVAALLVASRTTAARAINSLMTSTYSLIGRPLSRASSRARAAGVLPESPSDCAGAVCTIGGRRESAEGVCTIGSRSNPNSSDSRNERSKITDGGCRLLYGRGLLQIFGLWSTSLGVHPRPSGLLL